MAAARMAFDSDNTNQVEYLDEQTEEEYVLKREIETLMDNAMYSDTYRYLDELHKNKSGGNVAGYLKEMSELLAKWKDNYNKYTG